MGFTEAIFNVVKLDVTICPQQAQLQNGAQDSSSAWWLCSAAGCNTETVAGSLHSSLSIQGMQGNTSIYKPSISVSSFTGQR